MKISDVAWNLVGLVVPLVVAILTVPALLETLGKEKFGLLALAWGLIGYAGALDLGLGRALTHMVASLLGERKHITIPDTLVTASRITLIAGMTAGLLIVIIGLLGGSSIVKTQNTTESEIQLSMFLLAIALPAQAMSATYKGLNEAFMNFKGISFLRAALGILNFAGPYVMSIFSTQLPWLILTLVVSRLVALILYKYLAEQCLRRMLGENVISRYSPNVAKKLFLFGGWVTVSSVISPFMVQSDRFFIAAMISAAAVSAYVLPYEIVVQSLVLVGAVSTVVFPSFAKLLKEKPDALRSYFRESLLKIMLLMALVCICLFVLLPFIIPLWIGGEYSDESIFIGKVLCFGVFANSIGSMYYSLIQARGRVDLTAKIHIIELPVYILVLYIGVSEFGLLGAAVAWNFRMILDALMLYATCKAMKYV